MRLMTCGGGRVTRVLVRAVSGKTTIGGTAPEPLPMPLQSLVSEPALAKIDKLAQAGDPGAKKLATYWVGQGVGLMNQSTSVRHVVQEFIEDFAAAAERLGALVND